MYDSQINFDDILTIYMEYTGFKVLKEMRGEAGNMVSDKGDKK